MNELAQMVEDQMTYSEIADELGISRERARQRCNRIGLYATPKTAKTLRNRVQDMKAADAVEFLLGVFEELALAAPLDDHPVDAWGRFTTPLRRLLIILYDYQGRIVSKENLYAAVYFDRADADDIPHPKIIDVYICKLRKMLPDHVKVATVWGQGYRLVVDEAVE